MDKALEAGCCSAITPCAWQRIHPTTICPICRAGIPAAPAALPATDTSGLVERLRNPIDGWSYDVRLVAPEDAAEAADRIEALERRLANSETALQCALIREGNEKHNAEIARRHMNVEIGLREKAVAWATEQHREADRYAAELVAVKAVNQSLMGDDENVPRYTTKRLRQEIASATARLAAENERLRSVVTDEDIWLMASAAEHLRGGSHASENRAEIAFNIASKIDKLRDRIEAAALTGGSDGE